MGCMWGTWCTDRFGIVCVRRGKELQGAQVGLWVFAVGRQDANPSPYIDMGLWATWCTGEAGGNKVYGWGVHDIRLSAGPLPSIARQLARITQPCFIMVTGVIYVSSSGRCRGVVCGLGYKAHVWGTWVHRWVV